MFEKTKTKAKTKTKTIQHHKQLFIIEEDGGLFL